MLFCELRMRKGRKDQLGAPEAMAYIVTEDQCMVKAKCNCVVLYADDCLFILTVLSWLSIFISDIGRMYDSNY